MKSGFPTRFDTGSSNTGRDRRVVAPAVLAVFLLAGTCLAQAPSSQRSQDKQRKEDSTDYYRKWLNEDVVYIISEEERAVFTKLSTDEERDQFIEQFWFRRDPDPRTAENEYKLEHYRRIAYANERFAAGFPGWRTDRGKTYIIHGPPDEIEDHPAGGQYDRPLTEGGGLTATYPFEVWRYRQLDGVGTSIELQFVDQNNSNEYRLALSPDEKDAFLHVPTAGYTLAETLGLADRLHRPYYAPWASYPLMNYREQDSAFQRYERFVNVQKPEEIRYDDLKQLVTVDVSYDALPFKAEVDYFRLGENSVLVPITVQVRHSDLTFDADGGAAVGKVAIYGAVTGIDNRIAAEFEDELAASASPSDLRQVAGGSLYQKIVVLDPRMRYKLSLAVKDLKSGKIGASTLSVLPSSLSGDGLRASSLVMTDYVAPVQGGAADDEMFVLGDVVVRPRLDRRFAPGEYCALYMQLHNVAADQSSHRPYFSIRYRVLEDGQTRLQETDDTGTSVQYYSPNRMVLIKRLGLSDLAPGRYRVEVEFTDKIRGEKISSSQSFEVVAGS